MKMAAASLRENVAELNGTLAKVEEMQSSEHQSQYTLLSLNKQQSDNVVIEVQRKGPMKNNM